MKTKIFAAFVLITGLSGQVLFAENHELLNDPIVIIDTGHNDGGAFIEMTDENMDDGLDGEQPLSTRAYRAALNQHTLDVLQWQLQTSERILLLVMFMSTAGIVFAGYQLWRSFGGVDQRLQTQKADEQDAQGNQTSSTIAFSNGKFEVTSPIVGILILVISLGALYFFLTFVYQVDLVSVGGVPTATMEQ